MDGTLDDARHMARAIRLARRGLYGTSPNPRVGCVIVRDGEVVGEGWHERAGGPHAEVVALAAAAGSARGATAYVTLEPCCHHGRTPPCTEALLAAGVARVVAAGTDPDPRVAGAGLAALSRAGVRTAQGLLESEAADLNPGFLRRMRHGLPLVRCKLAASLDGRTAMASGESRWITGEAARRDVQRLRARSCAIVTGAGTVLADDPRLDVRIGGASARQPLRVVVDAAQRVSPAARVFEPPGPALLATVGAAPTFGAAGIDVLSLPAAAGGVDLRALLVALAERGCNEVLVEAGAILAGAFARSGLVDEYVLYVAPLLLGSSARSLLEMPLDSLAQARRLEVRDIVAVGDDWRIRARPRQGGAQDTARGAGGSE